MSPSADEERQSFGLSLVSAQDSFMTREMIANVLSRLGAIPFNFKN